MSLVVIAKVGAPQDDPDRPTKSQHATDGPAAHTSGPRDGRRHKICDVT